MVLMRRAGTGSSVLSNTNLGNMAVGGEGDWNASSRDGGSEGLHWWRWELKQGFAGTGLRARLGGGEYKVAFWLTTPPPPPPPPPPLAYIEPIWAAEESLLRLFAIPSEYSLLLACKLKIEIQNYFY